MNTADEELDSNVAGGLPTRVWRSVFRRPPIPRTDYDRKWVVAHTMVLHMRPVRVPAKTIRYTHTFGLGGMSMVLVLLLMSTGLLMMFVYEPTPERAYGSIVAMQQQVLFGRLVRGMHYWSANLLVIVALFHLLRVYLTGAFRGARQFNWILGLGLLACILVSAFTGYLLPWDQTSYWAITICTEMVAYVPLVGDALQRIIRAGPEVGAATMISFYTVHTTIMPAAFIVLMAWHFWRVRKAGGVIVPGNPGGRLERDDQRVLFLPHLLLRETVVALILVAVILQLAMFAAPSVGEAANPGMSPNPAKAPWYFLGFQELQLHFHPVFAVFLIPLLAAAALAYVAYARYDADLGGDWFLTARGKRMALVATATALLLTPAWVVFDEQVFAGGGASSPLGHGVASFAALLVGIIGFWSLMKRWFHASRNETAQALFVLLLVGFALLTVVGVWFRGEGMALVWPWTT
ncbi:MAG: cytochrome b N-terminal domain-containing protein [Acidobacteriota bacterium]